MNYEHEQTVVDTRFGNLRPVRYCRKQETLPIMQLGKVFRFNSGEAALHL